MSDFVLVNKSFSRKIGFSFLFFGIFCLFWPIAAFFVLGWTLDARIFSPVFGAAYLLVTVLGFPTLFFFLLSGYHNSDKSKLYGCILFFYMIFLAANVALFASLIQPFNMIQSFVPLIVYVNPRTFGNFISLLLLFIFFKIVSKREEDEYGSFSVKKKTANIVLLALLAANILSSVSFLTLINELFGTSIMDAASSRSGIELFFIEVPLYLVIYFSSYFIVSKRLSGKGHNVGKRAVFRFFMLQFAFCLIAFALFMLYALAGTSQ
jgi:hypothetical protein